LAGIRWDRAVRARAAWAAISLISMVMLMGPLEAKEGCVLKAAANEIGQPDDAATEARVTLPVENIEICNYSHNVYALCQSDDGPQIDHDELAYRTSHRVTGPYATQLGYDIAVAELAFEIEGISRLLIADFSIS
jgi:hypothetical protein